MKIPLKNIIITFLIMSSLLPTIAFADYQNELTISTIKYNYPLAKYEPTKGTYLGAYVLQDTSIEGSMKSFNKLTNKKHASYFAYVGYGMPFPSKWVEDVKSVGAVPHIALEPNNGLDQVKDDDYLRTFAKEANKADVPIFLRYASEMNGTWADYSGNPEQYIEKWRLVHKIMAQEAPNVIMVWTVFTFPESTITAYYPGDKYVDWVGVNIYNVMFHNKDMNYPGGNEDPLHLLDYVYNTYSYKKPIQISEFGASHYSVLNNQYYIDFARNRMSTLYRNLPTKYPRVKSIFYFDVNNLVNAREDRKINDYSVTDSVYMLEAYSRLVSQSHFLTEIEIVPENTLQDERLTFRGSLFKYRGKVYVDLAFYQNFLGLTVTKNGRIASLSDGNKTIKQRIIRKRVPKGYDNASRMVNGISLRDTAQAFGYKVDYNPTQNMISVYSKIYN
jgi:hypothetical protein